MQTLSDNLKKLRKAKRLSQQQLADKLKIGQRRYEAWENRGIEPCVDLLIKIARLYEISVDELVGNIP